MPRPPDQLGFVTTDLEQTVAALRASWGEDDWSVHLDALTRRSAGPAYVSWFVDDLAPCAERMARDGEILGPQRLGPPRRERRSRHRDRW